MMSRRDKSTPKGGRKPNSGVTALDAFSNPLFRGTAHSLLWRPPSTH